MVERLPGLRISAKPDTHSGEAGQFVLELSERSDAAVQLVDLLPLVNPDFVFRMDGPLTCI